MTPAHLPAQGWGASVPTRSAVKLFAFFPALSKLRFLGTLLLFSPLLPSIVLGNAYRERHQHSNGAARAKALDSIRTLSGSGSLGLALHHLQTETKCTATLVHFESAQPDSYKTHTQTQPGTNAAFPKPQWGMSAFKKFSVQHTL